MNVVLLAYNVYLLSCNYSRVFGIFMSHFIEWQQSISEFNLLLLYFVTTTLRFIVVIKFAIFSNALFSCHQILIPFYILVTKNGHTVIFMSSSFQTNVLISN
jgi:hypothetical protein